jgi:hypothetical protein
MEIVELRSAAGHREALPILRELYPSLDEGRYAKLLTEIRIPTRGPRSGAQQPQRPF